MPRTLHPQALPATNLRVASNLASFSAFGGEVQVAPFLTHSFAPADASPGLPRLLHLPALPAMDLRVAPNFASFSTSGALVWGCPRDYAFQLRLSMHSPGLPQIPASSGCAGDGSVSHLTACVLRRSWRCALGCPSASRFQMRLPMWWRVSPLLHPPASPRDCFQVSPNPLPWRRLMVPRVASVPAPSGLPSLRLQVSLNPASTAGSMMTSGSTSNFASSAEPRMNLRDRSGHASSRLALNAFLNLIRS